MDETPPRDMRFCAPPPAETSLSPALRWRCAVELGVTGGAEAVRA
jgi:hypothetical protein